MVHISVFTTPRVRLHFPDTHALCHTFTEEFVRLSETAPDKVTPGFSYDKHIEGAVNDALKYLGLPLEAQMEIPSNGFLTITLDLNSKLSAFTPSVAFH